MCSVAEIMEDCCDLESLIRVFFCASAAAGCALPRCASSSFASRRCFAHRWRASPLPHPHSFSAPRRRAATAGAMADTDARMSDAPTAAEMHTDDAANNATTAADTQAATVNTAAEARPTTQRARSSGGARGGATRLTPAAAAALTASARKAAAAAASQARAEAEAARAARLFTEEEHAALTRTLWTHGLESHPSSDSGGDQASSRRTGDREIRAHAATLAALPSKTPSEVSSYLRLWFWRAIIVPFVFASAAMRKAGAPGWRLNAAFIEEIRASHSLAPTATDAEEEALELVTQELSIPSATADAAPPASQPAHIVLSRWVARLRRCMLLSQMGHDASAVAASLQTLHLRYTADCIALLPRAKWSARDDAELILGARSRGYESLQPALMQARCDFLCDAFHAHCLEQARAIAEAQDLASARGLVLAASHAPAAASVSVVPVPASFSTPVWNGALMRRVFAVLTTHGLPTHCYAVAADTKLRLQAEAAAAAAAGTVVASTAEFVCPVCPLLDWASLFSLLSLHTGLQFDARWQRPLSALLSHACLEFEVKARRAVSGLHSKEDMVAESSSTFDLAPSSDRTAALSSSLCPDFLSYTALRSFRRSCLFFHQLRVRILDPSFHGFANGDAGVVEWVSQFAPGLTAPAAAVDPAAEAALQVGATLEAVQAEPAADFGRIVDGSASLLCSSPFASASLASTTGSASPADSAAGVAASDASSASSSSSMPRWYQIGFHDVCLLKSVSAWGLDLNAAFFERLNADLRRPMLSNGAADSSMRDAGSSSPVAPLSNLHWQDSVSWLAHSRSIIRQRMGESAAAPVSPGQPVEPLPSITPIEPHHHVALIKRAAQLVQSLAAVATDEMCNRLLQQVQATPAPTANGAAASTTNGATAAAAPASAASSLPFTLSPAGSASLSFFQHSLCGYQLQRPIYTLLRTRYYDLVPPPAAVAARLAVAAAKRSLSLHSSPAAAIAAARALGLSLVAPAAAVAAGVSPEDAASGSVGEGPENPLKLSDAAFLRPLPSATLMASQIAARFPRGVATNEALAATAAATAAAAAPRVKREQEDEMADEDLSATADDAASEEQAARSRFAETLDADRMRTALSARITALMGEDASAPCTVPWPVFVRADARLVLPQQLGPGLVLHALGELSPRHVVHSQRLIAARSAALAMQDDAESPAVAAAVQKSQQVIVLFPVGYRSVVRHASYRRPDRLVLYMCEIISVPTPDASSSSAASGSDLQFRVTASDDLSHPIVTTSAQAAWEAVSVAIAQMEAAETAAASGSGPAKSKRATAPVAAAAAAAVDGVARFGLDRPGVLHALAAEVRADPSMQRALADAFTPAQLSAHAAAMEACQFYSSSPSAAAPAAHVDAALASECTHNLLRLHRLTAPLVCPPSLPSLGPVYSASSSSVLALQAAALREHQLSAAHAAHQAQQHQMAMAQQQAQMRQRMEEEMQAAQQAAAQAAAAAYYTPQTYGFVHPQHYLAQQQQAQVAAAAAAAAAAQGYAQMQ